MALVSTKHPPVDVEFDAEDVPESNAFDEIIDLTDRRRVFVRLVLGMDLDDADPMFESASSS